MCKWDSVCAAGPVRCPPWSRTMSEDRWEGRAMLTVLRVEDHRLNRKLFRDILEMQFAVVEAGSAEEAREQLKTATPALILMDVQLPGIDGLTYVRELKADPRTAGIPVVAVSAHAMQRDIDLARD